MRISSEAIGHLVTMEGAKAQVYDDATGKTVSSFSETTGYPTIGVGHLIASGEQSKYSKYLKGGDSLSDGAIEDLLRDDLERFEEPLRERVSAPMTQSMWDALVTQALNTGLNRTSLKNAIASINSEDYEAAADYIASGPTTSKGRTLSGLVKRRAYETQLFLRDGLPTFLDSIPKWVVWAGVGVFALGAVGLAWRIRANRARR